MDVFGKPVRRWVIMSVLVPVVAAGLSLVGRFLQRRLGHPTRTSRFLLWGSRVLGRKQADAAADASTVQREVR
ncbi:hypothetical protein [Tomitella biformata]|uniref:hypothetical protein n=1 Tax=Tomitella biformata TaxID=630403 RepID=UPI0004B42850|nr:hypothetical protein [Tomitella biformata]